MSSTSNNPLPSTVPSSMPKPPSSSVGKKDRRRLKRKAVSTNSKDEAPMFLRKAYHIINTCDPTIATWADDGLSFYVKDQDRFATEVIPKCFKHNHFSSFVRQLNFYGFRKLREDHLELDNIDESRAKWCHFRHPKFQRNRPDLLKVISKNTHKEVAEKTELDALRTEVKDLKAVIKNMKKEFGILASLVGELSNQVHQRNGESTSPPSKKQKLNTSNPDGASIPASGSTITHTVPLIKPSSFGTSERAASEISTVSFSSEDEEFLSSLFTEDGFEADFALPDQIVS